MIVLDTHAWLWATVAPDRLSAAAKDAIETAEESLISVISCLEMTALVRRQRVVLDREVRAWIAQALSTPGVRSVDVDHDIAAYAGELPDPFPGDPADRLVYATSVVNGVRLITKDRAIREFDPARTIW